MLCDPEYVKPKQNKNPLRFCFLEFDLRISLNLPGI